MDLFASFLEKDLGLPTRLVPAIMDCFQEERLEKGTFLVKERQALHKLCFIEEGYLRFFSYSLDKEITHWIFSKYHIVTDVASFFLQEPAKWNIQALADTTLYALTYEAYQGMREKVPEWDAYEKLFLIKLMSALENRVYALLSMSAEERYQFLFQSDKKMFNELPLQYLASMLRMTPETLSRIRAKSNS
ncbi:MAG: cyclic nucleotide-binding domain-containing protein [Bacteroidota bacterium]